MATLADPGLGRGTLVLLFVLGAVAVVLLVWSMAGMIFGYLERRASAGDPRAERKRIRRYVDEIRDAQPLRLVDNSAIEWDIQSPDGYHFFPLGPAGPRVFSASTSRGFEQSPDGAALAAIHIINRAGVPNQQLESFPEAQVTGDGVPALREGLLALRDSGELMLLGEVGAYRSAYVGWTVVRYNPLGARINLAGIAALGSRTAKFRVAVTLTWVDGDWRLVVGAENSDNELKIFEVDDFHQLDVDFLAAFEVDGS